MAEPAPVFAPPVRLTEAHDSSTFNSGDAVLDDWLRQRAWSNMQAAPSRTYVVCPTGSDRVAGDFALSMGQILSQEVTGSMRRNMPRHIPAVVLGHLAVDRAWQGKGLGRALLAEVIRRSVLASTEVSVRLVVVHAISAPAEAFYLHHGFTRLLVETPTFAINVVKFQRVG